MQKLTSVEIIGKVGGESKEQVRRYIRLTYLIPELLKIVDDTVIYDKRSVLTLGITSAVALSYLTTEEQKLVYFTINYGEVTPNYAQAIKIRKHSEKHELTFDVIEKILDEKKGNQNDRIWIGKAVVEACVLADKAGRNGKSPIGFSSLAYTNFIELLEKEKSECRNWFTKYYEDGKYEYYGDVIKSSFNKWIEDNI